MRRPTFLEGVGVALVTSLLGSMLFSVVTPELNSGSVLQLLIAGFSFSYLIYLLRRSPERVGRVTVVLLWSVAASGIWLLGASLLLTLLLHTLLIWLVRSLYFYSSLFSALADLGLSGLAIIAALWATLQSGSLLLAIWCFFLVQALFVVIPKSLPRRATESNICDHDDRFQQAQRTAEAALRKLSTTH